MSLVNIARIFVNFQMMGLFNLCVYFLEFIWSLGMHELVLAFSGDECCF